MTRLQIAMAKLSLGRREKTEEFEDKGIGMPVSIDVQPGIISPFLFQNSEWLFDLHQPLIARG